MSDNQSDSEAPQLRAAVFNALAELPGVEVDTGVVDSTHETVASRANR